MSPLDDHEHEYHAIYMLNRPNEQLVFGISNLSSRLPHGKWEEVMAWARTLARARRELETYFPAQRFEIQSYGGDGDSSLRYYIAYEI